AVLDLFWALPEAERTTFLQLLGGELPAIYLAVAVGGLPPLELEQFQRLVLVPLVKNAFPVIFQEAYRLARTLPDTPDGKAEEALERLVGESLKKFDAQRTEQIQARFKKERERQSDPE